MLLAQQSSPYSSDYVKRLESQVEFYEYYFYLFLILFIITIIFLIYSLLRFYFYKKSHSPNQELKPPPLLQGTIYRFKLPELGEVKSISIGKMKGSIPTYSEVIEENHLVIRITHELLENYKIEISSDCGAMVKLSKKKYKFFNNLEITYEKGKLNLKINSHQIDIEKLVIRIGSQNYSKHKFQEGFFEFFISMNQNNLLLYLNKIHPGYDTALRTSDGMYPMLKPHPIKILKN